MENVYTIYAPRKKARKRKPPPPLEPLIPKDVAMKWHKEAQQAFSDAKEFLSWHENSWDERIEQLQTTAELIYGRIPAISSKYLLTHLEPKHEIKFQAPSATVLKNITSRCVLVKNQSSLTLLTKTKSQREIGVFSLSTKSVPSKIRIIVSEEMKIRLETHLKARMKGSIWDNEIRSLLARPLDATVFVNRAEQLDHPEASISFFAQENIAIPIHPTTGAPELLYPYSTLAHQASQKIAKQYRRVCDRASLKKHLHLLKSSICFLQLFVRFRLRRHRQVRVRSPTSHRAARIIQSQVLKRLNKKHKAAIQIQCVWRSYCLNYRLDHRCIQNQAAKKIAKIIRSYSTYNAWRNYCNQRIRRFCLGWCLQRLVILREVNRLSLELKAMTEAEKKERAATLVHLQTVDGKAELKTQMKIIRLEKKKTKSKAKIDLETQAIAEAFDAFDTDGSGVIDFDELQLLTSELGIPMPEKELREGFAAIDIDGNGGINFDEFCTWWKADAVRGEGKAHMALLKMKLRGQAWIHNMTGATERAAASKRILQRNLTKAKTVARSTFRAHMPPNCYCHVCFLSYPTERDWFLHIKLHLCSGRNIVALPTLFGHLNALGQK
ncbi:hypothetical protein THRCLA_23254 [Thraustotheca clavata]|uniref:EF-hand domain-containing protein n=1 Tax=Thraustotheca clavata TaxID=74557 RepID=A0A1V9Y8J5_9STRA|nr:hypothetical protein THRCLA_23254 [Thraustotheca clavata]